jgi:hypothetical protein
MLSSKIPNQVKRNQVFEANKVEDQEVDANYQDPLLNSEQISFGKSLAERKRGCERPA